MLSTSHSGQSLTLLLLQCLLSCWWSGVIQTASTCRISSCIVFLSVVAMVAMVTQWGTEPSLLLLLLYCADVLYKGTTQPRYRTKRNARWLYAELKLFLFHIWTLSGAAVRLTHAGHMRGCPSQTSQYLILCFSLWILRMFQSLVFDAFSHTSVWVHREINKTVVKVDGHHISPAPFMFDPVFVCNWWK